MKIVDGETGTIEGGNIVIIPAGIWHGFKTSSEKPVQMINVHPIPKMVTEWALL